MTDYKPFDKSSKTIQQESEQATETKAYLLEDYFALSLFWLLAITVFTQLFSRFLLSVPMGWTEEVARYQLICLGFIGACMAIRKNTHIYVVLFHRYLPSTLSLRLKQFIALFNPLFIALLATFAWQIMSKLHIHKMASLDLPISVLYGFIFASLLIMLLRSLQFLKCALSHPHITFDTPELK